MEFLYLGIGLILGALIAWLIAVNQSKQSNQSLLLKLSDLEKERSTSNFELEKSKGILQDRLDNLTKDFESLKKELSEERQRAEGLSNRNSKAESEYRNLLEKLNTQKVEYEELQKKFNIEFENIANKILKQHSVEFTQLNQKNIGDILNPLQEKIKDFEKKVGDTYDKEMREKVELKTEIKNLYNLNKIISEEANNLTKALKGDSKKQGNWGEVILERILERSGLNKGQEYDTQVSTHNDEGKRVQPDVIVYLPDKKNIIIDSKVSLVAYEKIVNATTEEEKAQHIKEHLLSIRTHIKGLSNKNYHLSEDFNTPDFVLLFIPIESSFSLAIQEDNELFNFAWDNKIVIVSPSTLLATLKTISAIWKQENQTKNAIEIARQSGALYDKFVGFISDLERIGSNVEKLHESYDEAMKKLQTGNGNLIKSVEKIRTLGAKTNKTIPEKYIVEEENKLQIDPIE